MRCWMGCFLHMFDLFHTTLWERVQGKHFKRGGPLKKNLEGHWMKLQSVTFKAAKSDFFTPRCASW